VTHAGKGEAILLLLALLAAFLTLAKPYLLALTVVKAFYDLCWFAPLLQATRLTLQRVLACNAAFFYLAFSLLLFALAAARGCLFSVTAQKRDTQLLFSRQFLRFFIEALCFAALSALLYFIWSPLVALFI
jgi:hypothetical protein